MKTLLLPALSLLAGLSAFGQPSDLRPYKDWETVAFCSFDSYHPSQYVTSDNNWELLYTLRTPMSIKELKSSGIDFSNSQLILLHIGGLIESKNNILHTVMPIFDKTQTDSLRRLSRTIAEEAYAQTESQWAAFDRELVRRGWKKNAYSLVFSYVLDKKPWGRQLPDFDDIQTNPTWNGAFWALYEPRRKSFCGTNGYETFHHTWSNPQNLWPQTKFLLRFKDEYATKGKITDAELLAQAVEWGLADKKGRVTLPVISLKGDDACVKISDEIVDRLTECLGRYSADFTTEYGISNENLAKVILYHEVMWDTMDILTARGIITEPDILKGGGNTRDFGQIAFIIE